ncbi:GGDEF domain-containing protein [Lysobacter koreensis]|uniref:diguanylate cyclase n=1 Tax=Lysobacter koreensis TaxID=266122 RepID=A0ABW2YNF3_9GAMM
MTPQGRQAPGDAEDDALPNSRLPTPDRDPLSPRRVATIRRLMLTGLGLFAVLAIGDFFILERHTRLVLLLRCGLIAMMFLPWLLARNARTSGQLAMWVYVQLLLASTGTSLNLYFDQTRLMAPINTMMLVIMVSGPAWSSLRYFVGGMLGSLVPLAIALAIAQVDAVAWYHYTVYLGASVLSAFALWRQRMHAANASALLRAELERRAVEDALTGVLNRAGWNTQATATLAAADAKDLPVSLLFLDLDHFKSINDRHGHAAGDAVIERAAQLIRNEVREHDLVARLGGEEFAVLLTGAGALRAHEVAGRIRRNFESDSGPVPGTLCVGVAERSPGESLAGLMDRADAALLRAKRNGRNRIESAVAS